MKNCLFGFLCFFHSLFDFLLVPATPATVIADASATPEKSASFDYARLKGLVRELSTQSFVSHKKNLRKSLWNLSWVDYQQLTFNHSHSLWRSDKSLV
jgi:glucans biosynthesis protein